MAAVVVRRAIAAPPERVWATVSDFAAYGQWIPLTTMRVDPAPVRVGWGFVGRTGLRRFGFDDSMLLTRWEPPGPEGMARFTVRKTGRLLAGWADIVLAPAAAGTELVWTEEIIVRPERIGRLMAPLADPVVGRLFAGAVARMAAIAEAGSE